MKQGGILHARLSGVVAEMGHTDLLCVADAGLPLPLGVERIDLAITRGRPAFLDVLDAVLAELTVEAYVLADEAREHRPELVGALADRLPEANAAFVSHEELKRRLAGARAIVRTGEVSPYANVLLQSGVDFSA